MESLFKRHPTINRVRSQGHKPIERAARQRQPEQPYPVYISYTHVINLRQELPNVLLHRPSITIKLCKIRHPKPSWVWHVIEIVRVWFLIYTLTHPFGVKPNSLGVLAICSLTHSAIPSWFPFPVLGVRGTGVLGKNTSGTGLCGTLMPIGCVFSP
jgi:hypothetical protein